MAFQTGTASSFINLLDALRLFATANGWTQNQWSAVGADQWLSLQKGSIYANFLASATQVQIKGALGYSGAAAWNAQPSTHSPTPRIRDGWYGAVTWPVTYWFQQHTTPDDIVVVVRYQPTRFFYFTVGTMTKYGTWPGGEYYAASSEHPTVGNDSAPIADQSPNAACNFAGLFWSKVGAFGYSAVPDILHCEVDSATWGGATRNQGGESPTSGIQILASASRHTYPLQNRLLSAFNGLTTLQPIWVHALRPDGLWSPIGRVEHVRYANVANHSPADIISIGGQQWMLFPWTEKGGPGDSAGQHYGMAIKYDGP